MRSQIEGAQHFLGLVGYVILVLGGIGVWSVTRVFLQQKRTSIAALKCLGATSARILTIYVLQALMLGLAGSALGLAGRRPRLAGRAAGRHRRPRRGPPRAVAGGGVARRRPRHAGVARQRARAARRHPPGQAAVAAPRASRRGRGASAARPAAGPGSIPVQMLAAVVVLALFAGLAAWQAGSWRVGGLRLGGFVVVALALVGAGAAFVRLVQPLARVRWFPLRHAVIGLGRPGHQTRVILVTVGLGCFFILATHLVERTLAARLSLDLRPDAPDLFFIDVQSDQRAGVQALLEARTRRGSTRLLPVARARVAGVTGREVNLDSVEAVRERGGLSREFTITWRDHLASNEQHRRGAFWRLADDGGARGVDRGGDARARPAPRRPHPLRHPRPRRSRRA